MATDEPKILWRPSPEDIERAAVTDFMRWLHHHRAIELDGPDALWRWSVDELQTFWGAVWDYFDITSGSPYSKVLGKRAMPGAEWFPGATLNYAEHALRNAVDHQPAMIVHSEDACPYEISWVQMRRDVGALAATLREAGVAMGDRVCAYMPNIPETLIAMLATASLGAIWSVCAPDYGLSGVVDRFSQLKPKILLAVDNYTFAGKIYSRTEELRALQSELDEQLVLTVLFSRGDAPIQHDFFGPTTTWADAVESPADIEFQRVPFDHPLWVLFSSGTTGPPKGIVHSHGGITLEQLKQGALGHDLRPTDRWYFYSSPSWAAWNTTVGTLLHGCTVVLYDGSPTYPDPLASWRVASESKATIFGSGAAYLGMCEKSDLKPTDQLDLTSLRLVLTTGSILAPSTWNWVYSAVGSQVRLESTLGTTDVCSGIVGGSPLKPVLAGELNGPYLGVRAEAWNATGKPVIDQGAELVLTEPMPSMPVYFWNDPSNERYREAYFSTWSGVWRNGDWVQMTRRGGITVEGRSDATLNKGGVRMGSADIYSVLEGIDGVADSLVVGVDLPGAQYYMPLFVVPAVGRALDDDLREEIVRTIRTKLSPRHVPDDVIDTPAIPRTRTGKKLELPIKKLLAGSLARDVANPASIDEPEAVDWFANFARTLRSRFNFNLDD